jgi:hypothetical protein
VIFLDAVGDRAFVDYVDDYRGAVRTADFFTRAFGVDGAELSDYCST